MKKGLFFISILTIFIGCLSERPRSVVAKTEKKVVQLQKAPKKPLSLQKDTTKKPVKTQPSVKPKDTNQKTEPQLPTKPKKPLFIFSTPPVTEIGTPTPISTSTVESMSSEKPSTFPPVVESIPLKTPESLEEATPPLSDLVTNLFVDTDIRQALKDIAFQAGKEIILDDTVRGLVSCQFNNMPFEEALEKLLIQGGYAYKRIKDYYLVGYPDPKNPTFKQLADVEMIELDYLQSAECTKLLPDVFSQYIKADKETNSLIVTAPSATIQTIKEHINKLDKRPGCVKIELLVVEMFSETRKILGMEWGYRGEELKELSDILPLTTFNIDNKNVLLQIKGLIEEGKVKIRANPKVTTLDGKPASISIQKEEYYLSPASIYQPYAKFDDIKSGIILKVTPFITKEDGIRLEIEPEVSDVTEIGREGLPVISRRTAKTSVIVKDKETLAIGGLIAEGKQERKKKLPLLGNIPVLGKLFSVNTKKNYETELVIFITPSVVK
jgi:type II secretory pathway component GspD/PulD (secretin)